MTCAAKRRAIHQDVPRAWRRWPFSGDCRQRFGQCPCLIGASSVDADCRASRLKGHHDRTSGPACAEHRRPSASQPRAEDRIERREESVDIRVGGLPPAVAPPNRVRRANRARQRVGLPGCTQRVELERNRDARALDPHRRREREEVVEVGGTERHVDGVDTCGLECGVVHHRRQRVHRVRADHTEHARPGLDPEEVIVVGHRLGRQLARSHRTAGIRPARSVVGGEEPRRYAGLSHADDDRVALFGNSLQRQRLGQSRDGDRHFDRAGAHAPHGPHAIVEIRRHAVEVVRRDHGAGGVARDDAGEIDAIRP